MSTKRPGFGPKQQPWIGFVGGVGLLGLAGWIYATSSSGWFIGWGIFGGLCILAGFSELKQQRTEEQALRYAPPTPRRELTAMVMNGLGATMDDLQANQQGVLTQHQWDIIQRDFPGKLKIESASQLQWVEGPVKLRPKASKTPAMVGVAGVDFQLRNNDLLECFKRTALYRIYYVELTLSVAWSSLRYKVMVAAEALGDA